MTDTVDEIQQLDEQYRQRTAHLSKGRNPELRKCNMCHKSKPIADFNWSDVKKAHKKTCAVCEEKHFKNANQPKNRKRKVYMAGPNMKPTNKPAPPAEQTTEQTVDLSKVSWLVKKQRQKGDPNPKVVVSNREIRFNKAFREQHKDVIDAAQTVDIGTAQNNGTTYLVFKPHTDMCGQYRISRGSRQDKPEWKICVSLAKNGVEIGPGPWLVREVDGVFVAEVEG